MIDAPLGDRSKWKPEWPDVEGPASSRSARRASCRAGAHVTVVTYGRMVPVALQAADELAAEGIEVEVDRSALARIRTTGTRSTASVQKTNRVLFVNEDTEVTNFGEHLIRRTSRSCSTSSTRRRSCSPARTCPASASPTPSSARASRSSIKSPRPCARSPSTSRRRGARAVLREALLIAGSPSD